jgi:hypothetical protein
MQTFLAAGLAMFSSLLPYKGRWGISRAPPEQRACAAAIASLFLIKQ